MNRIERDEIGDALAAAYEDDRKFPEFYHTLMNGCLFVVTEPDGGAGGPPVPDFKVARYELNGTFYIPVFSSTDFALNCFKKDLRVVKLPTPDAFRLLKGAPVVLNFMSYDDKLFSREEIQWLLDAHEKSQSN